MIKYVSKYFGPSTLITAAFIGPGTLTTCTLAGVKTGFELLWVLIFAIIATIVLQEMAARLGYKTQKGLGEALSSHFQGNLSRFLVFFLVIGAIVIGNAAYEAGNLSGGILGAELIMGNTKLWPLIIGLTCFGLLFLGGYKWVERILITLVILMSFCFALTAVIVGPSIVDIGSGFIPSFPSGDRLWLVLGLVGTTVVPYNLFLQASTISKKWRLSDSIADIRRENRTAIILGGLISMCIVITAGGSQRIIAEVQTAADLAIQLEPAFGRLSKWLMGIGLLAAGVSSALTAPLAASYAAKGLFGWKGDENSWNFRMVWMVILAIGIIVSMTQIDRVLIIYFAQITNAILLPLIAGYLIYICNSTKIMGEHKNGQIANAMAIMVVIICITLSVKSLLSLLY